jgi:choline dehydrogenase
VFDTIPPFTNHLPVRVHFGEGSARRLPTLLEELGLRRVALLIDEGVHDFNPAAAEVLRHLETSHVTRLEKPGGEPTIATVDWAAEQIEAAQADVVVALGGGSVIDTAKAARLCVQLGCHFADFLDSERIYPPAVVPLIAVPTTAGTGSEVSGGAVVTDPASGRKAGIANPRLRPHHAIVDPQLTWSMPPAMTANTGVDAIAQAIAAMVAKVRTPIGDAVALEAIRLMAGAVVAAYRDGSDKAARSQMSCGSLMAGLAMNISDCTAEHALGQAIGGLTGAPHGLTVGLVLAETLDRERRHVPHQLERVADALGSPDDGSHDGSRAAQAVRELLAALDFPVLSGLGITDEHLDGLTDAALDDYLLTMSPHPWTADEVRAAFQAALDLGPRTETLVAS